MGKLYKNIKKLEPYIYGTWLATIIFNIVRAIQIEDMEALRTSAVSGWGFALVWFLISQASDSLVRLHRRHTDALISILEKATVTPTTTSSTTTPPPKRHGRKAKK